MTNGMVFCRGCGKEIHSSAPMCPMCGAPQAVDFQAGAQAHAHVAQPAPAVVALGGARIDYESRSDISESWKRRFRLIEQAGGAGLPNFKNLSMQDRLAVNFNLLALLFSLIYYLIKGMWKQGIVYFCLAFVALLVLQAMGASESVLRIAQVLSALLFGSRANVNYYKKVVLGDETSWF